MKQLLITTFGLGFMRPAPGTWGSMPTAALAWAMLLLGTETVPYHAAMAAVLVVFSFACVWGGGWAESRFGRKDPSQVVADETAGQAIALVLPPTAWFAGAETPLMQGVRVTIFVAAAFVAFRVMDIIKPPPAHGLQRIKGGAGILIDDLLAGVYAAVIVQVVFRFIA
ncbi:MAG TPA: phosphatidylglycerophosphatase A [Phycisphaerales bacterium]|nr:phosphatidylglycerophosphatase A [Phycisphaerales bacterium]